MKKSTLFIALALASGCSDDGTGTASAGTVEEQVPPVSGKAAMRAWLAEGHYKDWNCETSVHGPIAISPHGMQRICSNLVLSNHGDGEYPVDAAAVKELYDDDGTNIVGYAVYRHVKAGMGGETWYWYEEVPADHPAPHDADGIVADGLGDSGPAKSICVGCHAAAGVDAMHPGHDYVYTQVK